MAQVSITQLPQAQALDGTESVPIVQGGVTVQTTTGSISGAGALNYPFLTVGSTVGLTQARYLSASSGLSLSDGGAGGQLVINLTGAALSLDTSGTGFQVKTALNTVTPRQLTVGGGMTISNADGVSGNPLIGLNANLQNLSSLSGTGLMTIAGSTFGQTTLQGTSNQVVVANGNGSGGAPTFSLASNAVLPGTGGVQVPSGTSGQRLANNGVFRYNTTLSRFEGYQGGTWVNMGLGDGTVTYVSGTTNQIAVTSPTSTPVISIVPNPILPGVGSVILPQGTTAERSAASFGALRYNTDTGGLEAYTQATGWGAIISGAGVSTFSASGTGFTPSSPVSGGVVLGGILNPASGGTGVNNGSYTTTLGGNVSTAGSFTTSGAFSLTLTTAGATNVTLPTTGTLATLAGAETLTNKTISGSNNTLTNIGNSSLTNSSLTFNGVTVSLGGSGTITANTTNDITFNDGGTGAASGTTFNGSAARTISYNTIGASPLAGSTSLITLGTVTTGTWNATAIANAYLANSSLTIGTTSISLGGTSLTLGGLTSVTVTQDPVNSLELATKQYVDSVAQGLNTKTPVLVATTANITLSGEQTIDGILTSSSRVLVKNQSASANNGIYVSSSGAWTRSTDANTWNQLVSAYVWVEEGTINADTGWVCTVDPGGTLGVTAVTWVQFSGAGTYTAGTGLTLTGTQFSITNTGVVAATYGNAAYTAFFTVNNQGQLTAAAISPIAIDGNQITSGTVGSAYISGSYTSITGLGTVTSGTWNATTIGVGYGGTGLASYTTGDLLYASGATTLSKLGIGTSGQVLTSSGSAPQWSNPSGITVGTATNAVNTGITSDSTNATNYLTFVSATSGNLPQLVNSSITCNPSTGQITGGIAGGAF